MVKFDTRSILVHEARIRYRVHGEGALTLVLLHGMSANHAWWRLVTPLLRDRYRVVEVDLSGHGDSDHRDEYTAEIWAEELAAVVAAIASPLVLVGHSMGGAISLMAAGTDNVVGVVTLDTPLLYHVLAKPDGAESRPSHTSSGRQRVFATYEEAQSRFVLAPSQPQPPASVLHPVACSSIREVDGGWTWKADHTKRPQFSDGYGDRALRDLRRPALFVRGQGSTVVVQGDPELCRDLVPEPHDREIATAEIAGAHHHLPLEAPAECFRLIDAFVQESVGEQLTARSQA